jgi:hypothetical protein
MRKLILVFVAIAITAGAYAQIDSTKKKLNQQDKQTQNMQNNLVDKSLADGIVMKDGKIMQVKNGKMTLLDRDVTLTNGTKIMVDGTFTNKDGSKTTFKEGQHMDMSGNVTSVKTNKDKTTYPVPESPKK